MKKIRTWILSIVILASLAMSSNAFAVLVTTTAELVQAVQNANYGGDATILVADGVYTLNDMLWVDADNVLVKSQSGNREAVILEGRGMSGFVTHIFNVAGSAFTVQDLTLRRVSQHAILFQPEAEAPVIRNVHILDTGEQMVKIAYYPSQLEVRVDDGVLENSLLEYSAGVGPQYYIGGIDAHNAQNWVVRNNIFRFIRSPSGSVAEHAVHFWSGSENTLVEKNVIVNCDRGIGFGLGDRGHVGGIIRNNMIYHNAVDGFGDVGIGLESAPGVQVYNNTIYQEHSYPNAIEYRFSATHDVLIANNLTNRAIVSRDGGSAQVVDNLTNAQAGWFQDPTTGDLHLAEAIPAVIDQGRSIEGLTDDFDGDARPRGDGIDIGADEWLTAGPATIFNTYEHADGDYRPTLTYEEQRVVSGHLDQPTVLRFRLSLYGEPRADMPLLVQVHEWGGDFAREEDIASYVPHEYQFVMLYFQYDPAEGNQDDWWFGTRWDGTLKLWAHDAIVAIVREAVSTSLVADHLPGVTVDPDRVYLFGHSIGGTGAWQLGIRNPDLFAAVHCHSGFARFTPPVGPFQEQFETDIVGTAEEHVMVAGENDQSYEARDYSNLAWWLENVRNPSWETTFVNITAGTADTTVPAESGGDLMQPVLDVQKRGFFYHRHWADHSEDCMVQMNWMWNFRLDQSFLAFTNRVGYGIDPGQTVSPGSEGGINDLHELSWNPGGIVDETQHYEVRLQGRGTADVTLRRLQAFVVIPDGSYRYWLDSKAGAGTPITADSFGLLTIPQVSAGHLLIVEPDQDLQEPVPALLANGVDGLLGVSPGTPVDITFSLAPNDYEGQTVDWWILARSRVGFFSLVDPSGWVWGLHRFAATPLVEIAPTSLIQFAPGGGCILFLFAVDDNADGNLDATWFDYSVVCVDPDGA